MPALVAVLRARDVRLGLGESALCASRQTRGEARRGHGYSPPSAIHFSSRQSAPSTILDRGALMPDCDYRPQV